MFKSLESRFREILPAVDFCSLRYVRQQDEMLAVRQDVPEPPESSFDAGAMITVVDKGGCGYSATSDLSLSGLKEAVSQARTWTRRSAGRSVIDFSKLPMPHPVGRYQGPQDKAWESLGLAEKFELLSRQSRALKTDAKIADWRASLWRTQVESLYLTSSGGRVEQSFYYICPNLSVTASHKALAQTRSLGSVVRQGGLEVLDACGFADAPPRLAREALELLEAPNCPEGKMDLLLAPDQMYLQIHESIGHPLELDRILGDERNYAGTSFVTPDMFGHYQYGSSLLNVVFDPGLPQEFASYGFDDDGSPAERVYLIEKGILQRPLGGLTSQARAGQAGTANSRACSWNRPPIDRMANINVEPGQCTLDEMISAVGRGIYMQTNCSWSIDDSRNKFQFGCEYARLIEEGRLTKVVRNPNYRGISATFWRSLKMVGDRSTWGVYGAPNCGKGEPNQIIRVGHASPACLFSEVEVFGGA